MSVHVCAAVCACVCMLEQEVFTILSPSTIIHWEFTVITTAVGKFRFTKKIDFGKFTVQWKKQIIKTLGGGYKVRTQGRMNHNDFLGLSCPEQCVTHWTTFSLFVFPVSLCSHMMPYPVSWKVMATLECSLLRDSQLYLVKNKTKQN